MSIAITFFANIVIFGQKTQTMTNIYDKILRDARVRLTSMFDNNFREQGFFGNKWVATKVPKINKAGKRGSILIVTGALRRSIRSHIRNNSVVFTSHLPYASVHNEGGKGCVTVRRHNRTSSKGKSFAVRSHARAVNIPQRQFIGDHDKVQQALGDIVRKNLQKFSENLVKKSMNK